MPAPRILPPVQELQKMIDGGMTHQQIADAVFDDTGVKVTRSAVSAAIHRAGLSQSYGDYKKWIPWTLRDEHQVVYPAKMLRLFGKREEGRDLTEDEARRLDSWLGKLAEQDLVVAYAPHTTSGMIYVVADEEGDRPDGVPIRPRLISPKELPTDL